MRPLAAGGDDLNYKDDVGGGSLPHRHGGDLNYKIAVVVASCRTDMVLLLFITKRRCWWLPARWA